MNKKNLYFIIVITGFLGFSTLLNAQVEDFQSWNSIGLSKKINKKISLSFEQEIRLSTNASFLKDYNTSIGGKYKFNKHFKLGGSYKFTSASDIEEGSSFEHRIYTDAIFRYKLHRFIFQNRLRYRIIFEPANKTQTQHIRNKFTLKYNIRKSKLLPFAECELYYSLNNPVYNSIDKRRFTTGLQYEVSKLIEISSYYRIQQRRAYNSKPYNYYILGLGINFNL